MKKVIKKEYLPNSKAYRVYYEGGGVGYGSDPSSDQAPPQEPKVDITKSLEMMGESDPNSVVREMDLYLDKDFQRKKFDSLGIEVANDGSPILNKQWEDFLNNNIDNGYTYDDLSDEQKLFMDLMTRGDE